MRKNFPTVWAVVIVFWLPGFHAAAQTQITGRITDAVTGEPIPFANVFFANTTIGSVTNPEGNFLISGFPAGTYEFSVRVVGYARYQETLSFTVNQAMQQNISLQPETIQLSEITIRPDSANWARNYADFKYHFLGHSRFARACEIKNPRALFLYFDIETSTLVAHGLEPLVIENQATGYRIIYDLAQFSFHAKTQVLEVFGIPRFEAMVPRNNAELRRWIRNRQEAYEGSVMHFMRAWHQGKWQEEGFTVSRFWRLPNPERPDDTFLKQRIQALRSQVMQGGNLNLTTKKGGAEDSLSNYLRLSNLPKEIDSVAQEILTGREFHQKGKPMDFVGMFKVGYKKKEDPEFAQLMGRPDKILRRGSELTIRTPVSVYANGYFEEVQAVFIEKYWSWSEKIATTLPLDFLPEGG